MKEVGFDVDVEEGNRNAIPDDVWTILGVPLSLGSLLHC